MLRRLLAYLERRYELRSAVERIGDTRLRPRIPTASVWWSVWGMFLLRHRSFNRLEQELLRPGRWERLVGPCKPSADTIGRVLSQLDLDALRGLVVQVTRKAWRNKAIHGTARDPYRVVALDGHELFSSTARCCSRCSEREVKDGTKTAVQYFHKVVAAQWTGVTPPALLDLELIEPGEGEVTAAKRLGPRLWANYPRLIDVVAADALYLEAPFLRVVLEAGKHFVIVLKQENRLLYQDADRLRRLITPQLVRQGNKTTRLWDLPQLSSFPTLGVDVRVVWAEETTVENQFVGGQRQAVVKERTWIWVTDLPPSSVPATTIQTWGHARWDIENRAFNELTTLWHADHCFIHEPRAIEAILLILALAFLVSFLFYERNLKPQARRHLTRLALADGLREGFSQLDQPGRIAKLRPG